MSKHIQHIENFKAHFSTFAPGIKLAQEVYDASNALTKKMDYLDGFIYENDELQLIQHEEGRIVPDATTGNYEYEYYLKDHLGNNRVLFTTKPKTIEFTTNYENNPNLPDDLGLFEEVAPANTISNDLFDHTDETGTTYTHTQLLTGGLNAQVGSVIAIPVGLGDTLSAEVFAKYKDNTGNGNNSGAVIAVLLINAFTGGTGMTNELGNQSINNNFGSGSLIGTTGFAPEDANAPMAFLNVMFLPEDETIDLEKNVSFAYDQIDAGAMQPNTSVKAAHDRLHIDGFVAPDQGYVLVYLSNESAVMTEVYFDDLKITVNEHPVIQRDDFYPFGGQFNSYQRITAKRNDFLFNGIERETELDLEWDLANYRAYDPMIGRWLQIDPKASERESPYVGFGNRPNFFIDPLGDTVRLLTQNDPRANDGATYIADNVTVTAEREKSPSQATSSTATLNLDFLSVIGINLVISSKNGSGPDADKLPDGDPNKRTVEHDLKELNSDLLDPLNVSATQKKFSKQGAPKPTESAMTSVGRAADAVGASKPAVGTPDTVSAASVLFADGVLYRIDSVKSNGKHHMIKTPIDSNGKEIGSPSIYNPPK